MNPLIVQVSTSLDRYSVEAEKYRAAAGYMAGHHNLYGHSAGPVDPVTAAAAKYLESSGKGFNTSGSSNDGGSQKNSNSSGSFLADLSTNKANDGNNYQSSNNNKSYSENGGNNDGSAAAKAYLETAKLYMDSKNYAAEVQRAYMDAAAKSIYGEGKLHDQHNSSSNSEGNGAGSMDGGVKSERTDGSSPSGIHSSSSPFSNPTALASYYSQAAAAVAGQAASNSAVNGAAAAAALSGIVPLSLSQYAPPTGTYPSSGEYRRPLPVIF